MSGFWSSVFGPGGGYEPPARAELMMADPPTPFAVDAESIDPAVFGLASYESPTAPAARMDRKSAIQVPAVKRCRDLIAGTLGTIPIDLFDAQSREVPSLLFEQPEKHRARSVTMTWTVENLVFEGIAWWQITEMTGGFPSSVKLLKPRDVTVDEDQGKVYVKGKHVPDDELIRFDSPNDALLVAGARAIRTALRLDAASANNADGVPALEYFTPAEGIDPGDDEEIVGMLDKYQDSLRRRSRVYIPAALKLNTGGYSPKELQLADARTHAVLEIGRLAGVGADALDIAVSTRTYFNAEHKRKEFVDFTLGDYLVAIEGRLSMNDVTPRGQYAKHNLDAFLRSDTKTRMETYEIAQRAGIYTDEEIRALEDLPPLAPGQQPAPIRALPSRQEDAS